MTNSTTISKTPEYQAALKQYKTNLKKYQPGPKWYFGSFESGTRFDGTEITVADMQKSAALVSPIGPAVSVDEVENITPSYDFFIELCGPNMDYSQYEKWVDDQKDAFFYGREKCSFYTGEAYRIAASLGYKKVILENYS